MYKYRKDHESKQPQLNNCDKCGEWVEVVIRIERLDFISRYCHTIIAKDLFEKDLCKNCLNLLIENEIKDANNPV